MKLINYTQFDWFFNEIFIPFSSGSILYGFFLITFSKDMNWLLLGVFIILSFIIIYLIKKGVDYSK